MYHLYEGKMLVINCAQVSVKRYWSLVVLKLVLRDAGYHFCPSECERLLVIKRVIKRVIKDAGYLLCPRE